MMKFDYMTILAICIGVVPPFIDQTRCHPISETGAKGSSKCVT